MTQTSTTPSPAPFRASNRPYAALFALAAMAAFWLPTLTNPAAATPANPLAAADAAPATVIVISAATAPVLM